MRLCFVNAFVFLKCSFLKGISTLRTVQWKQQVSNLLWTIVKSSLSLLHFYIQGRVALGGTAFTLPPSFLQSRSDSLDKAKSYPSHGRWSQVLSSSGWWDGGLCHSQLLSQVIEASNVVHAALTHHTSKLRVHLWAQPKSFQCTTVMTTEKKY